MDAPATLLVSFLPKDREVSMRVQALTKRAILRPWNNKILPKLPALHMLGSCGRSLPSKPRPRHGTRDMTFANTFRRSET